MKRILATVPLAVALFSARADFYVSTSGNDNNAGTMGAPFATVGRAQAAIRTVKASTGLPPGGITVWMRGGNYAITNTVTLTSLDSGSSTSPIVYASYPGEEAHIMGGLAVDPSWFSLVTSASPVWSRLDPSAQGKLYSVNLGSHGVTNLGTLKAFGFDGEFIAGMECFFNGKPLTLGQWPNCGAQWPNTSGGNSFARSITTPSSTSVTYSGTRPSRWLNATDVWLRGWWTFSWADFCLKVGTISTNTKTITFTSAPRDYGMTANMPYYAYNLIEEIDEPGEYYIDRSSGILYVWPPASLTGADIKVSLSEVPLVTINGAQYITFQDLVFEVCRSHLITVTSGDHNLFSRCLVRNAGQAGLTIAGSTNGVDTCDISDCGEEGVYLTGGNRTTLVAGGNYVTNSRIHRVSRLNWTYHPAINFDGGCGNIASHNLLDEMPHSAILFVGNNHLIEFNEIRRTVQYSSDAGAIYSEGRDWGYRGNVIRGNFIHHVRSTNHGDGAGAYAIYLDACMSGVTMSGNVLYGIDDTAILCGGGRDLIMSNNVIADAGVGHYNNACGRSIINNTTGSDFNLLAKLLAVHYQANPYLSAYPSCALIPNTWAAITNGAGLWLDPQNCVFSCNAGWSNGIAGWTNNTWMVQDTGWGPDVFDVYASTNNNQPAATPLFTDAATIDRSLRPAGITASPAGFQTIPLAAIGRSFVGQPAATLAPPAPYIMAQVSTPTQVTLQWTDDGNLPKNQETGFRLERRNEPNGLWQVVQSFGPDSDFTTSTGLAPATTYSFRVCASNTLGSSYSSPITLTTSTSFVAGAAIRIEAEKLPLAVVNDVGNNGAVTVQGTPLSSGNSVSLFDVGDALQIGFTNATAGFYQIAARVRSGDRYSPVDLWPDGYEGYRFVLNGTDILLVGDPTTVSAFASSWGLYWGTMYGAPVYLPAGTNALVVAAGTDYAFVDYIQVTPLSLPVVQTFPAWQQANFSADQLTNATLSGYAAKPAGDSIPNLLKFALGLPAWTYTASDGIQVSVVAGKLQVAYSRPQGLSGITYTVQASSDLQSWAAISQISLGLSGGFENMQATDTVTSAASRFIRLRVSYP